MPLLPLITLCPSFIPPTNSIAERSRSAEMAVASPARVTPPPTLPTNGPLASNVRRQESSNVNTYPLTTIWDRPSSCGEVTLSESEGSPLYVEYGSTSGLTSVFRFAGDCCGHTTSVLAEAFC